MSYTKNYIKKRGNNWSFYRRVPKDIKDTVGKEFITYSLKTDSETKAKELAAVHNRNTEAYWDSLRAKDNDAFQKYEVAMEAAKLFGYRYQPAIELAQAPLSEIVSRTKDVDQSINHNVKRTSLLGATDNPTLTFSEAMDHFFTLTKDVQLNKNETQLRQWKNPFIKALNNWKEVIGDKGLNECTRGDALEFRQWWLDRVQDESLTANSANKDLGKLNRIWNTCNDAYNLGLTPVFEKLRLKEDTDTERYPFDHEFIKNTLLNPKKLEGLNFEARMCIYQMASTGCGPNELCGLDAEDIYLDVEIPYIDVRPNKTRQLKNKFRKRKIPLHGSALWAFKQMPQGYDKYKGKNALLSSVIGKYLRDNDLKPSDHHSLYSLRHTFQDRLTAIEAPDRVQDDLMGHRYVRTKYGKGPSLEQFLKWIKEVSFNAP